MQLAKRLTDADKQKIIADYINNQNARETARMNGVSNYAVHKIIDNNEDIKQKITAKREETTTNMLEYFASQQTMKGRILNKLLKAIEEKSEDADTNTLKELATAYGIIMDKELKILEMQRGNGSREDLMKVEELLQKITDEAYK